MFLDVVLIKDEKLTRDAKKVFGDELVLSAYIAEGIITDQADAERDLIKRDSWDKSELYDDFDGIAYDRSTIVIQFSNNRYVLFTNSEWGSMENLNLSKLHFSSLNATPFQ